MNNCKPDTASLDGFPCGAGWVQVVHRKQFWAAEQKDKYLINVLNNILVWKTPIAGVTNCPPKILKHSEDTEF